MYTPFTLKVSHGSKSTLRGQLPIVQQYRYSMAIFFYKSHLRTHRIFSRNANIKLYFSNLRCHKICNLQHHFKDHWISGNLLTIRSATDLITYRQSIDTIYTQNETRKQIKIVSNVHHCFKKHKWCFCLKMLLDKYKFFLHLGFKVFLRIHSGLF